jgi:hypothetical protein
MNADAFARLQEDEQREDTPDAAMRSAIQNELIDVHTTLPGIIQDFDPATQTATVVPAVKRFFVQHGWVSLPPCMKVPVEFPRAGNFIITFPVKKGDECELAFNERCIDDWWDHGGIQERSDERMHDLSDAVARLGVSSRGRVPANIATDALEIRTLDGQTLIRVEDGVVIVGTTVGAEQAIKGETYRNAESTANAGLVQTFTSMAAACTGTLSPLQAGFQALAGFVQAFESTAPAYLAAKTKVG